MAHTTADKLQYLIEAKALIKNAIETMGVEVPEDTPLKEYANKILSISTDATAQASDIKLNETAYSGGQLITGTFDIVNDDIPEIGASISDVETVVNDILNN